MIQIGPRGRLVAELGYGLAIGRRFVGTPRFALARISHELSAAAPYTSASAAFYGAFLAPGA